jgi:hypothetical protein
MQRYMCLQFSRHADDFPAGDETLCPPRLTIVAENMSMSDMDGESQPSNERERFWLPAATNLSNGAKRRKEHLHRFVVPLRIRQRMQRYMCLQLSR